MTIKEFRDTVVGGVPAKVIKKLKSVSFSGCGRDASGI